jgi:hypothetical protein
MFWPGEPEQYFMNSPRSAARRLTQDFMYCSCTRGHLWRQPRSDDGPPPGDHIQVAYAKTAATADLAAYTKASLTVQLGIEVSFCGTKADGRAFWRSKFT